MASLQARQVRRRGENKLLSEDKPAHDWYRFVLSFPPHLVRDYLRRFQAGPEQRVLDPFCGTGTTLVECKKLGIPSIGMEANPVAHFASQVKTDWAIDPIALMKHATTVAAAASKVLSHDGVEAHALVGLPLFQGNATGSSSLRTLPSEKQKLLLTDSISPLPLHKTLVLLECLDQHRNDQLQRHALLALAKALVFSISNLEFGPEVGVGTHKPDAPVIEAWLNEVRAMVHDLSLLEASSTTSTLVYRSDARSPELTLEPNSIDLVITSPPYPNEKDYTRTTRLESVLLGFVQDKAELRSFKQDLIRSNTRGVYISDHDDEWIAQYPEIQHLAEAIEARRIALGKTSGFERLYARVTQLYFGGMARHLANLRPVLRPGAHLAYVVGDQASYLRILIRTGQLLGDIAQSLGYELVGIDLFRTRLATATREQLREEVVVLRWPG